jgi:hypothetical protein
MDVTSHVPIPIFGLILAVHHDSGAKERLTKKRENTRIAKFSRNLSVLDRCPCWERDGKRDHSKKT